MNMASTAAATRNLLSSVATGGRRSVHRSLVAENHSFFSTGFDSRRGISSSSLCAIQCRSSDSPSMSRTGQCLHQPAVILAPIQQTSRRNYMTTPPVAAPKRRGGKKGGNTKSSGEPLSNEVLIKTLLRNAGAASSDDITVRLVIDEGHDVPSTVEVLSLTKAIGVSVDRGFDLIAASIENVDPPVIRATDIAKLQFQRQQALKKSQQDAVSSGGGKKEKKSFRFRSGIDDHDLERKLSRMLSFLEKGHECDYSVFTRARNMREDNTAGRRLVDRIQDMISEHAVLKKEPEKNETGSFYKVMLRPKKTS